MLRANKLFCQIGHPIQETIIISIHVDGIIDFINQCATSLCSMSKTYCECILHHFRNPTKMVINIDSLGFTANAYGDADASLPALLLLLTIEILTSLLHFIHQLLRRRKIKLILAGDNRLVVLRQRHLHSRVILLRAK